MTDDEEEIDISWFKVTTNLGIKEILVCKYLIRQTDEVGKTRRKIIKHLRGLSDLFKDLNFKRSRLRYNYVAPTGILFDDQLLNDGLKSFPSLAIQDLDSENDKLFDCEDQPISKDCHAVLVARFSPSALNLRKWKELNIAKGKS